MSLREHLAEALRSRAEGDVRFSGSGKSRYYSPGFKFRAVGDFIVALGVVPTVTFPVLALRLHVEGLSAIRSFVGLGLLPLYAVFVVVACLCLPGWKSRGVIAAIGLLGTAAMVAWVGQLFGFVPPLHEEWPWLGVGSVLLLLGGSVATAAAYYGEWAKQYDT